MFTIIAITITVMWLKGSINSAVEAGVVKI